MDPKRKPVVMVVDDNPLSTKVVKKNLALLEYDVIDARDGKEAISVAEANLPDLILLDIMMPEMDGFEVIKVLKSKDKTKQIPIIFLTVINTPENILKGFELGAVDYITKPFNFNELYVRVKTHIENKLFQQQLHSMNNKLVKLDNEKTEFLGIAAHDLKNPIYNISMLAKIIHDDQNLSKEDVHEFSADIVKTCGKMSELIHNLLDINAIELGKVKLVPQNHCLVELAKTVVDNYEKRAEAKGLKISIDMEEDSINCYSDFNGTTQIIDNLVSNSLKFSPRDKSIFVSVKKSGDMVRFAIKDQGPGISEEDMTKLFGKFARLSATPTGDENSTGLGLSIVQKYVEAMNGKVWCESKIGEGAKFIVELPKENL